MVRWMNTIIPDTLRAVRGLQEVYGIGNHRAEQLCYAAGVHPNTHVSELRPWHLEQFTREIKLRGWVIQDELKKEIHDNIVLLQRIRHRRGIMHALQLPINNRRSHNNAKTQRKHAPRRGIEIPLDFL